MFRTDECNNPTALTTELAQQAGLILNTDYTVGPPFKIPTGILNTAILIGDPVAQTIRVIDAVGFYTMAGMQRWEYIAMPKFAWNTLPDLNATKNAPDATKRDVIGFMYAREGGNTMRPLFPNYGRL